MSDVENPTTRAIFGLLDRAGVSYERIVHPKVTTSVEAAQARGTPLHIGGKSLLFKMGTQLDFCLFVLAASRRTDNRPIRHFMGVQKLRFARPEELRTHTGLEPGCVPPFGRPIFDLPVFVDAAFAESDELAFTAADHRISVRMKMPEYLALARPDGIFSFSRD